MLYSTPDQLEFDYEFDDEFDCQETLDERIASAILSPENQLKLKLFWESHPSADVRAAWEYYSLNCS